MVRLSAQSKARKGAVSGSPGSLCKFTMERVYGGALDALGIEPTEIQRGARIELRFEVTRGHALPAAQIDGEEFPAAPRVTIAVLPRALRLIVP
jgi:hypothetical protein